MKEITGYISDIRYKAPDSNFMIFDVVCGNIEYTCKGNVPPIDVGANVEIKGNMVMDPGYGEQIVVSECMISAPTDLDGLKYYLGSGAIRGIGETMASRIVDMFGSQTMEILENQPERLAEVKGISERKAREIAIRFREKSETRAAMMFMQKYGISGNLSMKIYEEYGESVYSLLKENPYKLAEDIRGIGFKTADDIARKSGIEVDSEYRIRAGIMYILSNASQEGHMFLPLDEAVAQTVSLLGVPSDAVRLELSNLAMDRKAVIKEQDVYIAEYYYAELRCASMLHDLDTGACRPGVLMSDSIAEQRIDALENRLGMTFGEKQRSAVKEAISNGILIISGGPGTGKTTTINALIRLFSDEGMDIMLAAPTGRAAKRMTEATGYEARTIHRMLELSGSPEDDRNRARFERNETNPLEADVIIIDEMSMVDIFLFQSMLKAIAPGTRLVMVGDVDQLPSVGPGQVLKDIISSGAFKVVMLDRIFRQDKGSDIVRNAHDIREGRYPKLDNDSRDFFFLKRNDVNVIYKHIVQLITEKLPRYVGAEPIDIQVLTPTRKGPLGVQALNRILQRFINPGSDDKEEYEYGESLFRVGDKVMQIKNDYRLEWEVKGTYGITIQSGTGVFNGDIGRIKEINSTDRFVIVEYEEGHLIRYEFHQLDELELAYAVTIHKSQGSEYPAVIIPLLENARQLMNRNLLYTAITRARNSVVLLGSEDVVYKMVDNDRVGTRYTGLSKRIREVCL